MTKKIIFIVLLAGIVGVGIAVYLFNKPAGKTVGSKVAYTIDAVTLYKEFEENENKANEKYLNQVVAVKGIISEISEEGDGRGNITLNNGESIFGVSCQISEGLNASSLSEGDTVVIKGLCTGVLMDVVLVKCAIEEVLK